MALVVRVADNYRFFLLFLCVHMQGVHMVSKNHVGELCILNYHRGKSITKLSNRSLLCKIIETQKRKKRFLVTLTPPAPFLVRCVGEMSDWIRGKFVMRAARQWKISHCVFFSRNPDFI